MQNKQELIKELVEKLAERFLGERLPLDIVNAQTGTVIIPANRRITKTLLRQVANQHDNIDIDHSPLRRFVLNILEQFEGRFSALEAERRILATGDL